MLLSEILGCHAACICANGNAAKYASSGVFGCEPDGAALNSRTPNAKPHIYDVVQPLRQQLETESIDYSAQEVTSLSA